MSNCYVLSIIVPVVSWGLLFFWGFRPFKFSLALSFSSFALLWGEETKLRFTLCHYAWLLPVFSRMFWNVKGTRYFDGHSVVWQLISFKEKGAKWILHVCTNCDVLVRYFKKRGKGHIKYSLCSIHCLKNIRAESIKDISETWNWYFYSTAERSWNDPSWGYDLACLSGAV